MSVKRQATTELNHENWDQEDPEEQEEVGTFKSASKDILEKRVIRTAKRRTQASNDETKKSVFSGFGGFNKTQPSSFDFLANLTNGNKNINNNKAVNNDAPISNTLFSSKPTVGSPTGVFCTTPSPVKSSGISSTPITGNLFSTPATKAVPTSVFTPIKADTTVKDSPFKKQPATSAADTANVSNLADTKTTVIPTPQVTSNIFGISSTSGTTTIPGKSLFTTTNNTSSLFKTSTTNSPISNTANSNYAEIKSQDNNNDRKVKYYTKLKGLNESVSDWIKKHVEETPLCILTPIFKDYEKHLKEMQDENNCPDTDDSNKIINSQGKTTNSAQNEKNNETTGLSKTDTVNAKPSIFGNPNGDKPSGFSFGINSSGVTSTSAGFTFGNNSSSRITTTAASVGFSFGNTVSSTTTTTASTGFTIGITSTSTSTTTTSTPFSFPPNKTGNTNGGTPFSFGTGKPFSFSSNTIQKVENSEPKNEAQEDEDTPPKVEFTPIAEDNSVYDKRCKIFVKKDANFIDKGVGTLYIKKIDDSDKYQLLVRANTTLGNVLINLRLSPAIPAQRMGKNNVMLVCIPTPESKPPPTPVLIRVKTGEEADELLATLTKYKL